MSVMLIGGGKRIRTTEPLNTSSTCSQPTNSSMMLILLLLMVQILVVVSGSSLSDQVHQTPFNILAKRGEAARISCSHNIQNYDVILWYKRLEDKQLQLLGYRYKDNTNPEPGTDVKLEMDGSGDQGQTCTLTIKELSEKSSAVYYCAARYGANEAYFGKGTKLTVLEDGVNVTGPEVKILRPSPNECRDQKKEKGERRKTLVCVASGFYPDHVGVFWQINGQDITDGVATDAAAKKDERTKKFSITSRLRLQAKTWFKPDNEFTCCVTFFNGKNYTNYPASIKPNETDTGMTREKYLKITQNAKLSYSALIVKSCLYAALVCLLVWRLQSSPKKRNQ